MVVGGETSTEADANFGDPPVPDDESSIDGNTPTNDVAEDQFHGKCGYKFVSVERQVGHPTHENPLLL